MNVRATPLLSASAVLLSMFHQAATGAPIRLPPNPTPNTVAIAGALQRVCDQLLIPTNAKVLTPAQQDLSRQCAFFENPETSDASLSSAYTAVVGQQINALGPQTKKFSTLEQDNVTSRLAELRHGNSGEGLTSLDARGDPDHLLAANGASVMDYVPAASSGAGGGQSTFLDGRLGVFINGAIQSGDKKHTANSFQFGISNDSVTVGADYRVTDWFVAGAAYGYGKTKALFEQDLGRLDLKANGINLYASLYRSTFYLDFLAGYSNTDITSDRNLNYTNTTYGTTISQAALGSSHSHELWAGFSLGDSLYWGKFFAIPEGSLNFHEIRLNGFTESVSQSGAPGNGLGLSYGEGVIPSLQGRLGLRLGYTASTRWGVFQPQIHGTWIREFRNQADAFALTFAAAQGLGGVANQPAYIHTDTPEAHYWANGGGITAQFIRGVSAFVDYEQLRTLKSIKSHEWLLGLRWQIGE